MHTPGRNASHGRYQYVLDFSRKEVVEYIYEMMAKILSEAKVSYIKWDMTVSYTHLDVYKRQAWNNGTFL